MKLVTRFAIPIILILNAHNSLADAKSFSVPLQFDQFNTPFAVLNVNGNEIKLSLDTGSKIGLNVKHKNWMNFRNKKRVGTYKSADITGKVSKNIEYKVNDININGMVFNDISLTLLQPWGYSSGGRTA